MAVWTSAPAWITLALAGIDEIRMERAIAKRMKITGGVFL
jgi:hypothetical protein